MDRRSDKYVRTIKYINSWDNVHCFFARLMQIETFCFFKSSSRSRKYCHADSFLVRDVFIKHIRTRSRFNSRNRCARIPPWLKCSLGEREGNENDTVGCIPTRWDGLSLQVSRETPVVVPGARRRARICRISRWIFCKRSVRTRITRYADALRPANRCYNVHTLYVGRYSIRLNSMINSREDAAT